MRYYYDIGGFERFREAQRTYIRSSAKRRFVFHTTMWGLIALGVILLVIFMKTGAFHGRSGAIPVGICSGLIGGGCVTPLLRPWQLRRMHSMFNSNKHGSAYLEIDVPYLITGIEGRAENRLHRPVVCDVVEGDDLMLLFTAKRRFLYFSKQALGPEAVDELRTWLALPGAPTSC